MKGGWGYEKENGKRPLEAVLTSVPRVDECVGVHRVVGLDGLELDIFQKKDILELGSQTCLLLCIAIRVTSFIVNGYNTHILVIRIIPHILNRNPETPNVCYRQNVNQP